VHETSRPMCVRAEGTARMTGTDADVIDALVGIAPGCPLDVIRARRPEARAHAQASYRAVRAGGGVQRAQP
jgi:hypothetical protein